MLATEVLPDLSSAHIRAMEVCLQKPAEDGSLGALRALAESPDFQARRPVFLSTGYRRKGRYHTAWLQLLPENAEGWHVHVALMLRKHKARGHPMLVAAPAGPQGDIQKPQVVSSGTISRLLLRVGKGVDGEQVLVHSSAHFALSFRDHRPVVDIPAELTGPPARDVAIDILGVRLGWRDGTRSLIVDTTAGSEAEFAVYLRSRERLKLGERWLHDVLQHVCRCMAEVVESARAEE